MTVFNYNYFHRLDEATAYKQFEKDYFKSNIDVKVLKDALVLPQRVCKGNGPWMGLGGIVNVEGKFEECSGIEGFERNEGKLVFGGRYKTSEEEYSDEEVLYMGPWQPHWGHFLLEYITRLWYWVKEKPDVKIIYLGFNCSEDGIGGNYLKLLELLGIEENRLFFIKKPTRFRSVIVPEQSFLRWKYYSDEYHFLIEKIKSEVEKQCSAKTYKKIYFTREYFADSKERGEDRVRKAFEENGFKAFAPERLSSIEQIHLISHCDVFAVPIGGASMNAVFASNGCELIMVKKAFPDLDADIHVVAPACGARKCTFVDCYRKPFKSFPASTGGGPHLYGVTKELNDFFMDNGMMHIKPEGVVDHVEDRVWLSKLWIKYSLAKNETIMKIRNKIRKN